MREFLLVQEQINAILMGVTYKKREDFFREEEFFLLVDHIVESEKEANILGDAYEDNDKYGDFMVRLSKDCSFTSNLSS